MQHPEKRKTTDTTEQTDVQFDTRGKIWTNCLPPADQTNQINQTNQTEQTHQTNYIKQTEQIHQIRSDQSD